MSEQSDQEALFQWAAYNTARLPELALLFHVPNGGKRDPVTAARLKSQGVKPGIPDLWLPVAWLGFHGLVIELKVSGGRLSTAQSWWLDALRGQGYRVEVCYGWQDAAAVLETYLTGEPT
jgi:hypothetical protein